MINYKNVLFLYQFFMVIINNNVLLLLFIMFSSLKQVKNT